MCLCFQGFVEGRAANEWRGNWCQGLHGAIQLVVDRAMRNRPDCDPPPPQMLLIPYVPNVIDVENPAATFRRRLPAVGSRTTLIYSSTLCAQGEEDNMGKQLRFPTPAPLCSPPAPASCCCLHLQLEKTSTACPSPVYVEAVSADASSVMQESCV